MIKDILVLGSAEVSEHVLGIAGEPLHIKQFVEASSSTNPHFETCYKNDSNIKTKKQ